MSIDSASQLYIYSVSIQHPHGLCCGNYPDNPACPISLFLIVSAILILGSTLSCNPQYSSVHCHLFCSYLSDSGLVLYKAAIIVSILVGAGSRILIADAHVKWLQIEVR